jgi:AcrR family transcriptional regulator
MADTLDTAPPPRRRRADARRSIDAILNAARTVLGERPDASMEDIATTAGLTRQTVYAHFPSRDALIAALLHAAGAETLAAIDAAHLDAAPPASGRAKVARMRMVVVLPVPVRILCLLSSGNRRQ